MKRVTLVIFAVAAILSAALYGIVVKTSANDAVAFTDVAEPAPTPVDPALPFR